MHNRLLMTCVCFVCFGVPRTEIDGCSSAIVLQYTNTLGSRGSDALVRLSDVLAYAAVACGLSTGRTLHTE